MVYNYCHVCTLYSESERLGMMSFGIKSLRHKLTTASRQQVNGILSHAVLSLLTSSVVNKDLTLKAKAKAKDLSLDLKDKFKDCSLLLQLQWRRQDLMQGGTKTKKK